MNPIFRDPSPTPTQSTTDLAPVYPRLTAFLGRVLDVSFHVLAVLVPVWFCYAAIDAQELPKQTLLLMVATVMAIAWSGRVLAEKKFAFARNWLHLVVGSVGVGYLLLTALSQDVTLSVIGSMSQGAWSLSTMLALIVCYAVIVNRVRSTTQVYHLLFSVLLGIGLASAFGVIQMQEWFLFAGTSLATSGFNTVGTVFALSMLSAVGVVLAGGLAFHGCKNHLCALGEPSFRGQLTRGLVWASGIASLIVLIRVDFWPAWATVLVGLATTVGLGFLRAGKASLNGARGAAPAILAIIAFVMLFVRVPWQSTIPAEVAPSAKASWMIAQAALKDHPVFGTGPGTWIYDYAKYRVQIINESPLWNVRFDRGSSSFLTLLATVGIFGTALWMLLVVSVLVKAVAHLKDETNDDVWRALAVLFSGWVGITFSAFVYPFTVSHQALFWMLLALMGCLMTRQVLVWDGRRSASASGLMGIVFLAVCVMGVTITWLAGQRMYAERVFSTAMTSFKDGQSILDATTGFEHAVALNRKSDLYLRNLSQALLVQTSLLMQQGATPEVFANQVRPLVARMVELGIRARDVSPANVDNWANLAYLYQSIASFSAGADEHAIKNYLEAAAREPNNPAYYNEIGKIFILRADAYKAQLQAKEPAKVEEARRAVAENLRQAQEYLQQSAALKSDFFPARYHLGVVYERQGRIGEAITQLTVAAQQKPTDAGLAFELAMLHYRSSQQTQDQAQRKVRLDAAQQLFEKIVEFEPKRTNARWYLASLYEERGDLVRAVQQLEALMKIVTGGEVDVVRTKLEALKKETARPGIRAIPEPIRERVTPVGEKTIK